MIVVDTFLFSSFLSGDVLVILLFSLLFLNDVVLEHIRLV